MAEDDVTLNVRGLEQLMKSLKGNLPQARIGVLGGGTHTSKKASSHQPSIAEVGAVHEFGSPARGIPQRSFLRGPISDNLGKEMERSGAIDKDTLSEVIKSGSVIPWLTKVAILAEGIVLGAFDSGGYGKWAPWKKGYTNNTGQILVDSQQLRNAITYEVK